MSYTDSDGRQKLDGFPPESLDALRRNYWMDSFGISGCFRSESLSEMVRNTQSQLSELFYRPKDLYFCSFDLLWLNGEDLRSLPLLERKARLRKLIPWQPSRLLYVDHVERLGLALFDHVCALDLEGMVAKRILSKYHCSEKPSRDWLKIKNPNYSQKEGRAEMLEAFR